MSQSEVLNAASRTAFGTRPSRKLRAEGRIPANIQSDADHPHVDFSLDEREFLTTRRHHTHLYDIGIEGSTETAVVNELQWDAFGERITHVEFRRVQRGVKSEFEIALVITGMPKSGIATLMQDEITILTLPTMIPDQIEIKVDELEEGTHVTAADLVLPEGVELAVPPETEVAMITHQKEEEPAEDEEEPEAIEPEIIGEKKPDDEDGDED